MRTSFHHQPEAQHPNFQLPTSRQADYPIFWGKADIDGRVTSANSAVIAGIEMPQRSSLLPY